MVPLRAIFEALGAEVNWDEKSQTITAYNELTIVKCTIGDNTMHVNNVEKTIDVPPMIIDARTLVPVRFVAESFDCDVSWSPETMTVSVTTKPIDYTKVEPDTEKDAVSDTSDEDEEQPKTEPEIVSDKGTRSNPYSASDGKNVIYREWTSKPARKVAITCTNVMRGKEANNLIASENSYNDKPSSSQEWIFMEFNVKYISSEGGEDDVLKGSDVIYKDTFFTTSGSAVTASDMATFSHKYRGKGVFDVELYPGASSKVVIGLLIDKNIGDILLRVPNKSENTNTWINCTGDGKASSSYSYDEDEENDDDDYSYTGSASCYAGTDVPTYTSITGTKLSDTYTGDNGKKVYIYKYSKNAFTNYIAALESRGWTEFEHTDEDLMLSYYLVKGTKMVSVSFAAKYSQVWIIPVG